MNGKQNRGADLKRNLSIWAIVLTCLLAFCSAQAVEAAPFVPVFSVNIPGCFSNSSFSSGFNATGTCLGGNPIFPGTGTWTAHGTFDSTGLLFGGSDLGSNLTERVQFTDQITTNNNQASYIDFTYSITGDLSSGAHAELSEQNDFWSTFRTYALSAGTTTVTDRMVFVSGATNQLDVALTLYTGASGAASFGNTVTLTSVRVLDASFLELTDARVSSSTGLLYPSAPGAPVPEPSPLLLVAGGLAVVSGRRWRAGRTVARGC
jgi:hypothetical protein